MIGQNDLYDMTAVFKRIREDVQYPHNIIILQKVIDVLNTQNIYKANQIRNSIAEIPGLDQKKWYFVFHQNLYVHEILLKDSRIVNLLKKSIIYKSDIKRLTLKCRHLLINNWRL